MVIRSRCIVHLAPWFEECSPRVACCRLWVIFLGTSRKISPCFECSWLKLWS
jgi:hypothetical protein